METPIPVDLGRIAQDLQIRRVQVESVVQLLDESNTVPFIARYRKDRTGGLGEGVIREVQARVARARELTERKQTIAQAIEAQGRLTEELGTAIRNADSPKRLDDLYLPYKAKKKSKGTEARELGLEPLALRIWNRDESLTDLDAAAAEFVNPEKGLDSVDKVRAGVGHILAESISELAHVREAIRRALWKLGKVVTSKNENLPEGKGLDYRDYFAYSEPVGHIPAHRVLAINRGEKEGTLKVKLEVPRVELERTILGLLPLDDHPHREFFTASTLDALDRLLLPALEREIKRDLTEAAERHAVEVFARNLRSLLLQPPLEDQVVLAIDPGRKGCKLVVLDPQGQLLEHATVHPFSPQNRRYEAKQTIKDLVGKNRVQIVAIGNGTACREMEELVAEVIAEGAHFVNNPGVPFPVARRKSAAAAAAAEAAPTGGEPAHHEVAPSGEPAHHEVAPSGEPAHHEAAGASESTFAPAPVEGVEATAVEVAAPAEPSEPAGHDPHGTVTAAAEVGNGHGSHEHSVVEVTPHGDEAAPPVAGGSTETNESHEAAPPSDAPEHEPAPLATPLPDPSAERPLALPGAEIVNPPALEPPPVAAESAAPAAVETASEAHEAPAHETLAAAASESAPSAAGETATEAPATHPAATPAPSFATPLTQPPKGSGPKGGKPDRERDRERDREPRPPKPKTPPPPPSPHPADPLLAQLCYIIVNEAGANVYSSSTLGREELPEVEAELRGTISIGRRLLDPLTELVKVDPQNVGVGQYQHDVHPNQLKESLQQVVESCVNFVGVDLNSASPTLLSHVAGLNELLARRIVEHRKEKGPFASREALKQVEGVTDTVFHQAVGFLKIGAGENPLDRTWIHPESYPLAQKLLESAGHGPEALASAEALEALRVKLAELDVPALAKTLETSEPALHDVLTALAQADRDPRQDLPKPIFKRGLLKLEDLQSGMELKGTVLNVVDFGAFVDIGLKDSGLVHISQLANRYIKSPHDVVSVGDVVTVWVMNVDKDRKRVSLTMIQPGSERPRGSDRPERGPRGRGPAPGPEGGRGRGPGGGPDRPPQPRGPRPEGPAADRTGERRDEGEPRSQAAQAPRPASHRIPGPPLRMQQGGRPGGRGPGRGGFGGGGGGGRGPGGRPGGAREAAADTSPPAPRKPRPDPRPQPLSKDVIAGAAPLRSFGQLKQLFELRSKDDDEGGEPQPPSTAQDAAPPASPPPPSEPIPPPADESAPS